MGPVDEVSAAESTPLSPISSPTKNVGFRTSLWPAMPQVNAARWL
jgi:hypothetical protein